MKEITTRLYFDRTQILETPHAKLISIEKYEEELEISYGMNHMKLLLL